MLLIDDLLLAPLKGVLWVVEKIHDAAQEELAGEAEAITEQLRHLYTMIEREQITEAEFEQEERKLLDRLDRVQERESDSEGEADDIDIDDDGGEEDLDHEDDDEDDDNEDDDADGGEET